MNVNIMPSLFRVPPGAVVVNYGNCKLCKEPYLREGDGTDLGFCGRPICYLFRLKADRSNHFVGERKLFAHPRRAAYNRKGRATLPIVGKHRKAGHRTIRRAAV